MEMAASEGRRQGEGTMNGATQSWVRSAEQQGGSGLLAEGEEPRGQGGEGTRNAAAVQRHRAQGEERKQTAARSPRGHQA